MSRRDTYMERICADSEKAVIKRHCVICGNLFIPGKGIKHKCDACAGLAYRPSFTEEKTRFCAACGEVFKVCDGKRYYCSDECKGYMVKCRETDKPKKDTKKKMTAAEIAKKAREEHLNYGRYVAKYGL